MSMIGIQLELGKLPSAFRYKINGNQATKECLCIPLDSPFLKVNGNYIDLNLVAFERATPSEKGDTHSIKVSYPKEVREAMSDEERNAQPFIGTLRPIEKKESATAPIITNNGDLPF